MLLTRIIAVWNAIALLRAIIVATRSMQLKFRIGGRGIKIATLTMCKVIVIDIEIFVTMHHLIPGKRRISCSPGQHAVRPTQCVIIEETRETASFESSSVKF